MFRKMFSYGGPLLLAGAALVATPSPGRAQQIGGVHFGGEIEVLTGLNSGDTVVVHPGDDIPEGTAVEPVPLPK